jgi:proteasome accessory factor C
VEYHQDGSATFITPYADGSQLCSLALGMAADAVIKKPATLRKLIVKYLNKIESLHTGKPPTLIAAAARQPAVRPPESTKSNQLRQVKPEQFVKLSTLVAYLQQQLGEAETVILPMGRVCGDLGYKRLQELEKDLNLLQLVTFDTGYLVEAWIEGDNLRLERCVYGDLMKKPARLSPLEARALLLALDLVGDHLLAGRNCLLQSARQKIMQAAGGLSEDQAILVSETEKEDSSISQTIARGLEEHRLVEIEYLSQEDDRPRTRRIEPYMLTHTKGEWYLVAYCLRARDERVFRYQMIKSATLLDETFKPRQIDLHMYRANPLLPSGCEAPFRARVLFSPEVARFVGEKQPSAVLLDDGSLVDEIPYFSQNWLIREVLKYRGHAVVISPGELRSSIAETANNLAKNYPAGTFFS